MYTVTLEEMLDSRERRSNKIKDLVSEFNKPLVVFTLNIPGNRKVFELVREAFFEGCSRIQNAFRNEIEYMAASPHVTGYEAFYVINHDVYDIKRKMLELETIDSLGRLFDFDVYASDGTRIPRSKVGAKPRTCLLCDRDTFICNRENNHTVQELLIRISEILDEQFNEH